MQWLRLSAKTVGIDDWDQILVTADAKSESTVREDEDDNTVIVSSIHAGRTSRRTERAIEVADAYRFAVRVSFNRAGAVRDNHSAVSRSVFLLPPQQPGLRRPEVCDQSGILRGGKSHLGKIINGNLAAEIGVRASRGGLRESAG